MSAGGCNPIGTTNIQNIFGITNNIYGKALFGQAQKKTPLAIWARGVVGGRY